MRRKATENVTLSDGTFIPKDTMSVVFCDTMFDDSVYPNPNTFDGYRFLKMRQIPGQETSAQFVSPSPDHMGFGLGKHACPGRFFAANELKIVLCHILLKYNIRLAKDSVPKIRRYALFLDADASAEVEIQRRKEELQISEVLQVS